MNDNGFIARTLIFNVYPRLIIFVFISCDTIWAIQKDFIPFKLIQRSLFTGQSPEIVENTHK